MQKFLNELQLKSDSPQVLRLHWIGPFESGFFILSGELRATVGIHIAAIAVMYGLDVEGELAMALPVFDEPENE